MFHKPFFFVCTYVDIDIQNTEVDEGNDFHQDTETIRKTIKRNCLENLKPETEKGETDMLYLINTRSAKEHDFQRLDEDIMGNFGQHGLKIFLHCLNEVYHEESRFHEIIPTKVKRDPNKIYKHLVKSWQNVHINFAITGDSGTGKSSFINAVRG